MVTGSVGEMDEIRIAFPIVPHEGTYAGVGWQARGIRSDSVVPPPAENRLPGNSLQVAGKDYFSTSVGSNTAAAKRSALPVEKPDNPFGEENGLR